jgi:putative colanic acid biosynthesis acetyltransferase WcaF
VSHRAYRLAWNVCWLILASWTPRPFYRWRRFLLRAFGATLGENTDVLSGARVWDPRNLIMGKHALIASGVEVYNMDIVELEEFALISQNAFICAGTHDYNDVDFPLVTKPILIKRRAWVCSRAIVGPGVTIGEGAVLGAGAIAFKDLKPFTVYAGNPACEVGLRKLNKS